MAPEPMLITVAGWIPSSKAGFCQSHEHLLIARGEPYRSSGVLLMDEPEKSLEDLLDFKHAGGGTVVDAQPVGCGRMAEGLRELSLRSGVNIIASTGFHKLEYYPVDHWISTLPRDRLTRIFIHELERGMYTDADGALPEKDCGIRAGLIKTAADSYYNGRYDSLFHAAIDAALETGATVMTHIEKGADHMAILDMLLAAGVGAEQIIFCHTDRAIDDIDEICRLAERGIFLEMDTIARPKYHSDERELDIFCALIGRGYGGQLLFSLDTTRARLKGYTPQAAGLDYLLNNFVPAMANRGVQKAEILAISHDNFVRAFANKSKNTEEK